jgi:hypothetical protein
LCERLGVTCEGRPLGGGRNLRHDKRLIVIGGQTIEQCPVVLGQETGEEYLPGPLTQAMRQGLVNQAIGGDLSG